MLVLTIRQMANGLKESLKILDKETGEILTVGCVKANPKQQMLAIKASNRFQIRRFIEGSSEDPFNSENKNPSKHITQDYEKLKEIRKILASIEMGQEWDNPISQAYLNIARIIDEK